MNIIIANEKQVIKGSLGTAYLTMSLPGVFGADSRCGINRFYKMAGEEYKALTKALADKTSGVVRVEVFVERIDTGEGDIEFCRTLRVIARGSLKIKNTESDLFCPTRLILKK